MPDAEDQPAENVSAGADWIDGLREARGGVVSEKISEAINESFIGYHDNDLVNVPDSIIALTNQARAIAKSIAIGGTGKDSAGGTVECLTEAVMGVTAGLVEIADAIRSLADAVRESK